MALKLGTENKTKTYAAVGLSLIMLILLVHFLYSNFFAGSTPAPVASTPIAAPPAARLESSSTVARQDPGSSLAATPFAHQAIVIPSGSALDPTLHPEVMEQAEETAYTGNGRNIFSPNSAPAPAPHIEATHNPIRPGPVVPQGPPPPPNIDLKFYGYAAAKGGAHRVFLLHGDDIFLAYEGDVVDRRYKVVKINPFSIEVEDLPYSHTQSLPLTQN